MNCRNAEEMMMETLEPGAVLSAPLADHVAGCPPCAEQLAGLRDTMAALDHWSAPEISPWFESRLNARLREEATLQSQGFFARLRDRLLFNTGAAFKPAMSGALAAIMLVVGGSYGFQAMHPAPPPVSAAVQDLQQLDSDAGALQQMDQLADDSVDDNTPS